MNHTEISKQLVDLTLTFLKEICGGIHIEDAVVLFSTIVAERCIEAAGDYSIYNHYKVPGEIFMSRHINKLLYGDYGACVTVKINGLPQESVFGQIWGSLQNSTYQINDFPSIKLLAERFTARIGKESWGNFPWSVPTENIPFVLPLKVGYETRNKVDSILKPVAKKIEKLRVCIQALCEFLLMAKDFFDNKIVLLLTFETIYGMANTVPLTDKAMLEWKREQASLYVARSKVYQSQKKYDLAIQNLNTAMKLEPEKSYFFYFLRHLQFLGLGDLEKSFDDIKKAVNLAPKEYMYHKYLAHVYEKLGQIDQAVLALKQEIEENPGSKHAYLDNAKFFEGIGRFEEALKHINDAIQLEPEWLYSYHKRANIYTKMGQFDDALKDCNFCINKQPNECTHYQLRSNVYKAMGNTSAAESDYITSCNLNPCINR